MQIDDRMMRELGDVRAAVKPTDTLLVVDAMTGQEAAGLVKAFNDAAEITGASAAMPNLFAAAFLLSQHIGSRCLQSPCRAPAWGLSSSSRCYIAATSSCERCRPCCCVYSVYVWL